MFQTIHGDESDDEGLSQALAASMEDSQPEQISMEPCLALPGCIVYPAEFFDGLDFSDYICSVCKNIPKSPQSGCSQHHILCGNCAAHMHGRNCPECRETLNTVAEIAFARRKVAKKVDTLKELRVWCDWQCFSHLRCNWTGKGIDEYEKHMGSCPGLAMQRREQQMRVELDQAVQMHSKALEELEREKEKSSKREASFKEESSKRKASLKEDLDYLKRQYSRRGDALAVVQAALKAEKDSASRREALLKAEKAAAEECVKFLRQEVCKELRVNQKLNRENQKLKGEVDELTNWVPMAKRHKKGRVDYHSSQFQK